MPQMKVENRYCSELREKNDALNENCVTFEIRDESSPESSPPLNGFLQNGQLIKNDQSQHARNGRNREDKTLSGLSKNRDPLLNDIGPYPSNVVNGGNPSKVVNGHCSNGGNLKANEGDLKGSLFPDTLLSSIACKPNASDMKVKKGCETQDLGDFTDLLLLIQDQESKCNNEGKHTNVKAFNRHVADSELQKSAFATRNDDNLSSILTSISFAEPDVPQQNVCLNFTKKNGPEINNGGLSDILSNISFDDIDTPKQNCTLKSSSSIKDNDANELFSELSFLNSHKSAPLKSTPSALQSNGSLSDMLSCIDFHEAKVKPKSLTDEKLVNDSLFGLKELSTELLNTKDSSDKDKCFSFPTNLNDKSNGTSEYNINELLQSSSAVDTPKTTKKSPKNNATNDFSFFSVSPDNVFPSILSGLHTSSNQQAKNSNENTDNISMLDLLKSVNTDSSSSFSGYLGSNETDPVTKIASEDLSELLDIDLSGCIKSCENTDNIHQDLPLNSTGFETTDVILEDHITPVFEEIDANRPKINKSQSLFAKALSCKPKRNMELLQKASFVKSELYKLYFNRELLENAELNKNFKLKKDVYTNTEMVVCKTNTCMVTFKGRRFCPSEVH